MLSVIICTRNRAEKLAQCLRSFEEAQAPTGDWELLVVDNASRDRTKEVVNLVSERKILPLKYIVEAQPGLSHARNCGLAHATGSIVAFTDDDCLVSRPWMDAILYEFTDDRDVMVVGGRVDLADRQDLPIGIRPFSDRLQIFSFNQIMERLIGCNMAFRREVFHTVGLFDPRLGAGTPVGSAEDIDLFYRAIKVGMKACYSPEVLIWHAHGRVSDTEVSALKDNYVKGRGALYSKHLLRGDHEIFKYAGYEIKSLLRGLTARRAVAAEEYTSGQALRNLAHGALSRFRLRRFQA